MAEHLASIFGTEKDRVNCPFYFKVRSRVALGTLSLSHERSSRTE